MYLTQQHQKIVLYVAVLYLIIGLIFDYSLHKKNAPTGAKYRPTLKYITGWPYYYTKSNL